MSDTPLGFHCPVSSPQQNNPDNESLPDLIARQFGLITVEQADGFRLRPPAISRRVKSGEWAWVLPSVYRVTAAPTSARQTALAAALWAGSDALVSHSAAAALWEFDGVRAPKAELWVPHARNLRSPLVSVHRGTRLDRADRTEFDGIPITTVTRTLIDMAGRLEDHRLLAVTEDLIRRDLVDPRSAARTAQCLRATSGRPGGGRLEELLDQRGDGRPLESALEALAWPIIRRSGVPLPARQHWVTTTRGRYRLDFAWPGLKVALECEGWSHHGGRGGLGKRPCTSRRARRRGMAHPADHVGDLPRQPRSGRRMDPNDARERRLTDSLSRVFSSARTIRTVNPAAAASVGVAGAVFDLEPERHADRIVDFFGEVADEPGGAGDEHEAADARRRDAAVDERRAAGAGAVDRAGAGPTRPSCTSATSRRSRSCGPRRPASLGELVEARGARVLRPCARDGRARARARRLATGRDRARRRRRATRLVGLGARGLPSASARNWAVSPAGPRNTLPAPSNPAATAPCTDSGAPGVGEPGRQRARREAVVGERHEHRVEHAGLARRSARGGSPAGTRARSA